MVYVALVDGSAEAFTTLTSHAYKPFKDCRVEASLAGFAPEGLEDEAL
jgi:hypothetical protein